MEDMLPETEQANNVKETVTPDGVSPAQSAVPSTAVAESIGVLLKEHKGGNVLVLDLREMNGWTDCFVIATAASGAHMDGMERHIKDFCHGRGIEILRRSRKPAAEDDEWRLIDLGPVVIHLMSERLRSFYELERLYSDARELFTPAHSSKSS